MQIFVRPARVTVEESGGGLAAAVAVVALAAVISSAAAAVADVLTAVLITMTALALAGLGVLAIVLRRHGLRAPLPPGPARTARALTGPPLAIEAPRLARPSPASTPAAAPGPVTEAERAGWRSWVRRELDREPEPDDYDSGCGRCSSTEHAICYPAPVEYS